MHRILLGVVVLICFACGTPKSEDKTTGFITIPSLYSDQEIGTELRLFPDSTFVLRSQHEMGFMMVELGDVVTNSQGSLSLQKGFEVERYLSLEADSAVSDNLTLRLIHQDTDAFTDPVKLHLFDSIVYTFENDVLSLDKKRLFGSIPWAVPYEDFDSMLMGQMVLKSGPYVMVIFESGPVSEVRFTLPTKEELASFGTPKTTGILRTDGDQLIIQDPLDETRTIATLTL